jgi:hypothetical protein
MKEGVSRRDVLKGIGATAGAVTLEKVLPEDLHFINAAAAEHLKPGIEAVSDGYKRLFGEVRTSNVERADLLVFGSEGSKSGWVPLKGETYVAPDLSVASIRITEEDYERALKVWATENQNSTRADMVLTHIHPSPIGIPSTTQILKGLGKLPESFPIPKSQEEINAFLRSKKFSDSPSYGDVNADSAQRWNTRMLIALRKNSDRAFASALLSVLDEAGAWFYRPTLSRQPIDDPRAFILERRRAWHARTLLSPTSESWDTLMKSPEFTNLINGYPQDCFNFLLTLRRYHEGR